MLEDILCEFKPHNWTNFSYDRKRYVLVPINSNEIEYREVITPFRNYGTVIVERVQHPYALGYFMLRKQQLESRGQYMTVERRYHPISSVDKHAALEYNLDVRKYNSGDKITPLLYLNVDKLVAQYDTFIVCKTLLGESNRKVLQLEPSCESEYMPEYVVQISKY